MTKPAKAKRRAYLRQAQQESRQRLTDAKGCQLAVRLDSASRAALERGAAYFGSPKRGAIQEAVNAALQHSFPESLTREQFETFRALAMGN